MTVEILLTPLRQPRHAPGWRLMRCASALALLLLTACAVPTEEQEYGRFFGTLERDGVGGGPVMTNPGCVPVVGSRACTDTEAHAAACALGCQAYPNGPDEPTDGWVAACLDANGCRL